MFGGPFRPYSDPVTQVSNSSPLVYYVKQFFIECHETNEGRYHQKPIRTQSNNKQTRKARENASDQTAISFSFASDWLIRWRELSRPIREQNKAKPMQYLITFLAKLEIKRETFNSLPRSQLSSHM